MTRAEIQAEARQWLGVRYRKQGRSRRGIDCLGIPVMIGRRFDVPHEDRTDYHSEPDLDRLILTTFDRYLLRVNPQNLKPGMCGVFAETRLPCHAGIFTWLHDRLHIVHARLDVQKVVEQEYRPQDILPEMRLIRAYDFPGVED